MIEEARRAQFEEALSEEAYQSAWRYACRLCTVAGVVQRAEAEDLLQESLVHAFSRLHQLRDRASFKSWLLSIMRTRFITRYRRQQASAAAEERRQVQLELAGDATELTELVQAALASLPTAQQELLSLFYLEGLSLKETGRVLGLAPHSVRQRLFRARDALRRALGIAPARRSASNATPEGVLPCE
jgi:RNA polymerase sigma-70 factor, ECF subfamily